MPSGAKRWCFTINNPGEDDTFWDFDIKLPRDKKLVHFEELVEYFIVQEERGHQEETVHYQGFVHFKQRKTLEWLKKVINPRAHWEVARGSDEDNQKYCSKDDTYTGGLRVEYGEIPHPVVHKGEEKQALAIQEIDEIKEGYKRPSEIPSEQLLMPGFVGAYKLLTADILGPYRKLTVVTLVGPPGCGKSYAVHHKFPEHALFMKGNGGQWFNNAGEKVLVMDDYTGEMPMAKFCQVVDEYPFALEVKGGFVPAMYEIVLITSNVRPNQWYKRDIQDGDDSKRAWQFRAIYDRIGFTDGSFIPVRENRYYLEVPTNFNVVMQRKWCMEQLDRIFDGEPDLLHGTSLSTDDVPPAGTPPPAAQAAADL